MMALNHQRKDERGYCNRQQSQSHTQNSVAHPDLQCWLVNRDVPRSETDKKLN